jgi:hypothetical protein
VGHGEFVTEWPASFADSEGAAAAASTVAGRRQAWLQQLPAYCRDLAVIVLGQQPVNFNVQRQPGGKLGSSRSNGSSSSDVRSAAAPDVDAEVLLANAADRN